MFLLLCFLAGWIGLLVLISTTLLISFISKRNPSRAGNGMLPINTTDKNVWYDQASNRCNIMSCVLLEQMAEAEFR